MSQNEHDETVSSSGPRAITRREFTRRVAIASAATTLSPAVLVPAAKAVFLEGSFPALQDSPDKPKPSPEGMIELEARTQLIFARYGKRFSDEQKADIRRLQRLLQPQLESLRAYGLTNGDPPALYLKPLVEREQPRATKTAAPSKR